MRHTGNYWWLEVFCGLGLVGADVLLSSWFVHVDPCLQVYRLIDGDLLRTDKTPEWVLYITLIPNVRRPSNHALLCAYLKYFSLT